MTGGFPLRGNVNHTFKFVVSITANTFQEVTAMMRIGTRVSPDWLDRPEDLRFLVQIGVDAVDITMDMVPGYMETGGARVATA